MMGRLCFPVSVFSISLKNTRPVNKYVYGPLSIIPQKRESYLGR